MGFPRNESLSQSQVCLQILLMGKPPHSDYFQGNQINLDCFSEFHPLAQPQDKLFSLRDGASFQQGQVSE